MLKRKNTDTTTLEIEQLRIELARSKAREQGLLIEREMWVEQGASSRTRSRPGSVCTPACSTSSAAVW